MARRGSSPLELKKKRKKNEQKVKNLGGDKKYVQNRNNTQGGGVTITKKPTKQLTGKERAQAMFKKNKAKGMGTAQAAAANKEAMRLKIKKKYQASKKKKK